MGDDEHRSALVTAGEVAQGAGRPRRGQGDGFGAGKGARVGVLAEPPYGFGVLLGHLRDGPALTPSEVHFPQPLLDVHRQAQRRRRGSRRQAGAAERGAGDRVHAAAGGPGSEAGPLGHALGSQGDVGDSGVPVLRVPLGLAVAHQQETRGHGGRPSEVEVESKQKRKQKQKPDAPGAGLIAGSRERC